ncbi:MAG: hypothetical protein MI806_13725 [Minwuiales bacterium]|nr:hypothetical protein [Minwuiales bacterium]
MRRASLSPSIREAFEALPKRSDLRRRLWNAVTGAVHADIDALLEQHEPAHVAAIAEQMRLVVDGFIWDFCKDADLRSPGGAAGVIDRIWAAAPDAAMALTVAWSGYIREAAVASVAHLQGPFALALLLLRTNDWVPAVRRAAQQKLDALMAAQNGLAVDDIVACMDLLLDPSRFGRISDEERAMLDRLMRYPGVDRALDDFVATSPLDRAPRYLNLALRQGRFVDALEDLALTARHARVRLIALKALLTGRHVWQGQGGLQSIELRPAADPDRLVEAGLTDRSSDVQRTALQHVLENKQSRLHTEATFRRFLFHRNLSLVERAVFGHRSVGVDVLAELRDRLAPEAPELVAARILGRFGDKADGDLIYRARQGCAPDEAVRFLAAAARLGNAMAADDLRRIVLENPDPIAARQAAKALQRSGNSLDFNQFRAAVKARLKLEERGILRSLTAYSAIQLAQAMAIMMYAGVGIDYRPLWRLMARKRNRGAFQPADTEIAALRKDVGSHRDLAIRLERALGIRLLDKDPP